MVAVCTHTVVLHCMWSTKQHPCGRFPSSPPKCCSHFVTNENGASYWNNMYCSASIIIKQKAAVYIHRSKWFSCISYITQKITRIQNNESILERMTVTGIHSCDANWTLRIVFLCACVCLRTMLTFGLPVHKIWSTQLSVAFQNCSPPPQVLL